MVITQDIGKFSINMDLSVDFAFTQAITVEQPRMIMIIPASLDFTNVGPASSPEERTSLEKVIEETITDIVTEGLEEGQELVSVTLLTIGGALYEEELFLVQTVLISSICINYKHESYKQPPSLSKRLFSKYHAPMLLHVQS